MTTQRGTARRGAKAVLPQRPLNAYPELYLGSVEFPLILAFYMPCLLLNNLQWLPIFCWVHAEFLDRLSSTRA